MAAVTRSIGEFQSFLFCAETEPGMSACEGTRTGTGAMLPNIRARGGRGTRLVDIYALSC